MRLDYQAFSHNLKGQEPLAGNTLLFVVANVPIAVLFVRTEN